MHDNANFDLVTVSTLKERTLIVPNYQRGYKWTSKEVLDLLNDIDQFKADQYQYCLQPLVLKNTADENTYELLDGQQRCTTIFIILSAISLQNPPFYLDYRTRAASGIFLKEIRFLPKHTVDIEKVNAIDELWESYIEESPDKDNIDNYHFYRAYQLAYSWMRKKSEHEKQRFIKKLLDHSFFIWYVIEETEKPELVFQRFNSGKIQLTGAELIKATLILDIQKEKNFEIRTLRLNEFALRWDVIESRLQNQEMWYFLYDGKGDLETRIDLLFDLQVNKPQDIDDDFFAYRQYDEWFRNDENLPDKWLELTRIFQMLMDWFSDIRIYHLIGFLIHAGFESLSDIVRKSKDFSSKMAFKQHLEQSIKDQLKKKGKGEEFLYELEKLKYYNPGYQRTKRVLLLFNIFSYEALLPDVRFPFWRYKKEEWTLEHIHPQNPQELESIGDVKEWLEEQSRIVKGEPTGNSLGVEVEALQNEAEKIVGERIPQAFRDKLKDLSERLVDLLDLHGISNLALLDRESNSSIGNKPFLSKRKQILEREQGLASFIPLATRNVFVKYYTNKTEAIQMQFWSSIDADDYEEAIAKMLAGYLP